MFGKHEDRPCNKIRGQAALFQQRWHYHQTKSTLVLAWMLGFPPQ